MTIDQMLICDEEDAIPIPDSPAAGLRLPKQENHQFMEKPCPRAEPSRVDADADADADDAAPFW